MVTGRPLLYLSLPGVAFILGVFWFRRRNRNRRDTGDGQQPAATADKETPTRAGGTAADDEKLLAEKTHANGVQHNRTAGAPPPASKSMNINGTLPNGQATAAHDDDNPATKLFGKSAPISIVQNGRSCSPASKQAQQQQQQQQQQKQQPPIVDSEVLKTKIQDVEYKALRSIDEDYENLSSPVDLPDSFNNRRSFYNNTRTVRSSQKDEPVVIKATRTPKISPENSFLESKYTKECSEPNNNCEPPATVAASKAAEGSVVVVEGSESAAIVDAAVHLINGNVGADVTATTTTLLNGVDVEAEDADENNKKRTVDAASPALSVCSVQSGDSGTGSSLPRSEAARAKLRYEFLFPVNLIGHLYGRQRAFLGQIKAKTAADVVLHQTRYSDKLRVCSVEGTEAEVNGALAMIRQRMPLKRYPNFTMERIHFALPQTVVPLSTESLLNLQLNLIERINNDVVVSAVISGSHIFVQHPLHPSHPSLAVLQKCLYDRYTTSEAPLLPGVEISAVCVMPVNGIWYRVQIVDASADTEAGEEQCCVVKFLDFGGYMNVHFNELRQIRSEFMAVPFQATECLLSNVEPIDDTCWSPEAADVLSKLTKGIVLQAQVAGYNSQNVPEVFLFASLGPNNVIFINKELEARNLAKWVEVRD